MYHTNNFFFVSKGDIYESVMDNVTGPRKWRRVAGHLKKVLCGCDGIVWGFGFDGIPYVRCAGDTFVGPMESEEDHVIFENQRWNPVGGFTQRFVGNNSDGSTKPNFSTQKRVTCCNLYKIIFQLKYLSY